MHGASGRGWLGLALLVLAGCGSGDGKLTQVQGRVLYRDQPLPGGTIVFAPDPERGAAGALASSEISPDGHYTLHTEGRPGAVPGWHRVTVAAPAPAPRKEGTPASVPLAGSWVLPRHFSHPDQSGQLHEVKPGALNTIDIKLE